jgi:cystathionine beta-synthase
MAVKMIADAEADGRLKPGGTIVKLNIWKYWNGIGFSCCSMGYKLICDVR